MVVEFKGRKWERVTSPHPCFCEGCDVLPLQRDLPCALGETPPCDMNHVLRALAAGGEA